MGGVKVDPQILDALPGVLREVAQATGLGAALKLAGEFGGTEIWVPEKMTPDHRLARALGIDAAAAVVALYGMGHLLVPLGPLADAGRKRREIMAMIEKSRPAAEIARVLRCHVRTVYRTKSRSVAGDTNQLDLLAPPRAKAE